MKLTYSLLSAALLAVGASSSLQATTSEKTSPLEAHIVSLAQEETVPEGLQNTGFDQVFKNRNSCSHLVDPNC